MSEKIRKKTPKKKSKELTEKEKLFCQIYINNFNAAAAAIKAGYSTKCARAIGYENLTKPHIRKEITRLKNEKAKSLMIGKTDIVERYMRIAFSDMTDFVTFKGNLVKVNDSKTVDGGIINQISQTKHGVTIKLEDRMKALEWLANYFEINPDSQHRKEYDLQRIKIEQEKLQVMKEKIGPLGEVGSDFESEFSELIDR